MLLLLYFLCVYRDLLKEIIATLARDMSVYGLPSRERLKSKIVFQQLFEGGQSFASYPVRVVYLVAPGDETGRMQVAFSVSKKRIRKAVCRNLLKRRMREAFRLHAGPLREQLQAATSGIDLVLLYTSQDISAYREIESSVRYILRRIQKGLLVHQTPGP